MDRRILVIGLVLAGMGAGCKREDVRGPGTNAPVATRPPRMAGPTAEAIAQQNMEQQWKEFYPFQRLGEGVFAPGPDGEAWTKYSSGLMVRDLRPNRDEPSPRIGQTVTLSYVGTIAETGKEFERCPAERPFTYQMGSRKVIHGLSMGLTTMKLGSKRKIYVPADLGYGAEGNEKIPGGSALVFEVELLKITGDGLAVPVEGEFPTMEPLGPPVPAGMKVVPTGTGPGA